MDVSRKFLGSSCSLLWLKAAVTIADHSETGSLDSNTRLTQYVCLLKVTEVTTAAVARFFVRFFAGDDAL